MAKVSPEASEGAGRLQTLLESARELIATTPLESAQGRALINCVKRMILDREWHDMAHLAANTRNTQLSERYLEREQALVIKARRLAREREIDNPDYRGGIDIFDRAYWDLVHYYGPSDDYSHIMATKGFSEMLFAIHPHLRGEVQTLVNE